MTVHRVVKACLLVAALLACGKGGQSVRGNTGVTAATHLGFPIATGVHATDCSTCHGDFQSFKQFTCLNCHTHDQPLTNELHASLVAGAAGSDGGMGYAYSSASCLQCHATGTRVPFDHVGITSTCASCHDTGAPFVALAVAGVGLDGGTFMHPDKGGNDCRTCHTTTSWSGAGNAPDGVRDPAQDVPVAALIPTYVDTSIASVSAQSETLPMPMDHKSTALPAGALSACSNCHSNANAGAFFPGNLHSSLMRLALTQPGQCLDCHATSVPSGFVGPTATNPARTPPSGEMKHDAVVWKNAAPTTTAAVTQDCAVCHTSPTPAAPSWKTTLPLHSSLAKAAVAQPASCLDCHANSRPVAALTSANAALPAKVTFDHGASAAMGDCVSCHSGSSATTFTSWTGGQFHLPGSATPATCLPCHNGERPTSTAGWVSGFQNRPFDYVTNSLLITHGDGQDCVSCHANPGTGVWGGTPKQNWAKGQFDHGASGSAAATTCFACHLTQRPDLVLGSAAAAAAVLPGNFDHSLNGTGDCFGCHQATATANTYVNYFKPATGTLPGGDWQGGVGYPGSTLVSAPNKFITITETTLNPPPPNLVTGTTSISATLHNAMLHTSTEVPVAIRPGPTPPDTSCKNCHTATSTFGDPYANGQFHSRIAVQPTAHCTDCHSQMRPKGIVFQSGSELQPMDHNAVFASAATINSNGVPVSVTGVAQIDCSACHKSPGNTWSDGVFHANIKPAVPANCTACHYTVMADAASADMTSGASYVMRHKSGQMTFQNCQTCHAGALAKGASTTLAAALWKPGSFHASLSAQPRACVDCHAVSEPAANASTQSNSTYNLAAGSTSTNGAQWMNHGSSVVVGKDCFLCHAADAKVSGSAWNKGDSLHAAVASMVTCRECHGLTNGGGAAVGTNNNLPAGLTNSSTLTSASADSSTGIPLGTFAQITHADINASAHDCNFCHTQVGLSTVAGVKGKEWAQAAFHTRFTGPNPMVINGTTGRCSNCHMNVKPVPSYTAQDHSAFTAASGTQDCASCHSWPGTGTAALPNWLGATGVPQFIPVGGFPIPQPPATSATTQLGIASLPHPSVASGVACTTCHSSPSGSKPATGYDHASALINANCASCHEAGSNLVGTVWNGTTVQASGAGDTRPFTTSLTQCNLPATALHFYPPSGTAAALGDCNLCHRTPAGNGTTTTGAAFTAAWQWHHPSKQGSKSSFPCLVCHVQANCGN